MTELEEFDAWLAREFAGVAVPDALRAIGFFFWRAGRKSLIGAAGAPVEIRTLRETQ